MDGTEGGSSVWCRGSRGGQGYNQGQAKDAGDLMVDLHFTYRDDPTRLCCELDDLKEDEIPVVVE